MIIYTKQKIRVSGADRMVFEAPAAYIGEVPAWVEKDWYFKALCKDGTITVHADSGKASAAATPKPAKPPKGTDAGSDTGSEPPEGADKTKE
jgi:hypothetical protein